MAWRRHNRNLTKEVFYDGTTIDGSRLEKAMGEIEEGINNVKKGDTRQRFVATQYHAGFNPQARTLPTQTHRAPWLQVDNTDVYGSPAIGAPFNILRFKGTAVPGIDHATSTGGHQFAWTRTFHFTRPVILHATSVFIHNDGGATTTRPYPGTDNPLGPPPYTYGTPAPQGFNPGDSTVDVPIVIDVMCPGSLEDAELTDVEYTRTRWAINEERASLVEPDSAAADWDDMLPPYASAPLFTDQRPLLGRVVEHRGLNIPIHENARVRVAVLIPDYTNAAASNVSWGVFPWAVQAWSATLTVLEEVQAP